MGDGSRAFKRRARTRGFVRQLLAPFVGSLRMPAIDGLVQCGLGDWAEGPILLEYFPDFPYLAIEPLHRYVHEAWRDGFRGPIIQAALDTTTNKIIELHDFRTRTSIHDTEPRTGGSFLTRTITLDDALEFTQYPGKSLLLWMDCEGAELNILKAAEATLRKTSVIVCELKDVPKFKNWPNSVEVIAALESYGFHLLHRVSDDGLFLGYV